MAGNIKFIGVFDGLALKKDGKFDLHFDISAQELAGALPIVTAAKVYLELAIADSTTGELSELAQVGYKSLNVKAEGDARLTFESSLGELGKSGLRGIAELIERPVFVSISPAKLLGVLPGMTEVAVQGFGG